MGPLFPIAEMQCRWFVQLVAGNFNLPSVEKMKADIEKYRNFRLRYDYIELYLSTYKLSKLMNIFLSLKKAILRILIDTGHKSNGFLI